MSQPRTKAGRELSLRALAQRLNYDSAILAIEAEAAHPEPVGLREARDLIRDLTAWAGMYGGLPQTLQDRADWWRLDVDPALAAPSEVKRHPITGAPMCCCLGGKEPCDHHGVGQ